MGCCLLGVVGNVGDVLVAVQAAQQAQEDRLLQHRLPALPLDADELAEYALDGRARHLARGSRLQIVETSILI